MPPGVALTSDDRHDSSLTAVADQRRKASYCGAILSHRYCPGGQSAAKELAQREHQHCRGCRDGGCLAVEDAPDLETETTPRAAARVSIAFP